MGRAKERACLTLYPRRAKISTGSAENSAEAEMLLAAELFAGAKEAENMSDTEQMLQRYKRIAVVGLSANPSRPSYSVSQYMQAAGYEIIPINPRYAGTTILGKYVYASLTEAREAGERIEIVDVFRRSADTTPVAAEAIDVGAKAVWLQLGIVNREAGERVRDAGLEFVEDRCIKVEYARFFAQI